MWVEYSRTGADITSSPRVPGRVMITNIGLHGWDCRLRRASRVKTIISLQTPALILINLRIDHRRQMPSPKNLLICVKVGTPRAGAYKQSPRKGRAVLTELLCTYVVPVLAGLPGLGRGNQEEKYMPYYHFVVRAPDYTYDDPDGTHFPNHEAAREHGHRVVRELREDGYDPRNAALLIQDGARQTIHSIPLRATATSIPNLPRPCE